MVNFPWYFVPPLLTTMLIAALGFGTLIGDGKKIGKEGVQLVVSHWLPTTLLVPLMSVLAFLLLLIGRIPGMTKESTAIRSLPAYLPTALWLAENTPEGSDFVTIEIGVLGYHSDRNVVDTMGLISPDMSQHQLGWVETLVYAISAH